jgi:hypothetical protein
LGPIVLQEKDQEIILLDGQQRLATATILLACIRDIARDLEPPGEHVASDVARDIHAKFIEKGDSEVGRYSLVLGELDEMYFKQTIKCDSPKKDVKPRLRSHKLMQSAYSSLRRKVEELVAGKSVAEALCVLKALRNSVTKGMTMVAINVQSEEDAYSIFETLNDRGLRLSVPDLLLNLLMRNARIKQNRDDVRQKWNYMLQEMGRRDISRFLRHMWLSKYGDLKARGLFKEMKAYVTKQGVESLTFAETCANECENYISLLDCGTEIPKDAKIHVEALVKNLNATSSLPLLLSGLSCLSQSDFAKLASAVLALFVRYALLSNLNPSNLESTFYEAARELRGKKSTNERSARCVRAALGILARINPTDATVQERAKDIALNKRQAIWLMIGVAKAMQSKTKEIGFDKISLEHIFPLNAGSDSGILQFWERD